MTLGLFSTLLLLALLDSLNPITIGATVFLLLTPRPVARTGTFLAGVCLAYFTGGRYSTSVSGPCSRGYWTTSAARGCTYCSSASAS